MIDYEFGGKEGIDFFRVAAHLGNSVPHGREIGDRRYPGEILQQHSRRHEGNLRALLGDRLPFCKRLDVLGFDEAPVLLAHEVLEQNPDGDGKLAHMSDASALKRLEAMDLVALVSYLERIARAERVL